MKDRAQSTLTQLACAICYMDIERHKRGLYTQTRAKKHWDQLSGLEHDEYLNKARDFAYTLHNINDNLLNKLHELTGWKEN